MNGTIPTATTEDSAHNDQHLHPSSPPKKKKVWKIVLIVLVSIAVLSSGVSFFLNRNQSDEGNNGGGTLEQSYEADDYRRVPPHDELCQPVEQVANTFVPQPREPAPQPGNRESIGTCIYKTQIGKEQFRSLDIAVRSHSPAFGKGNTIVTAVQGAKDDFAFQVKSQQDGLLGEVKEAKPISGLGDEAMQFSILKQEDFGITVVVARKRNVTVRTVFQGSNNKTVCITGGCFPEINPLAPEISQDGAIQATRQMLTNFQ